MSASTLAYKKESPHKLCKAYCARRASSDHLGRGESPKAKSLSPSWRLNKTIGRLPFLSVRSKDSNSLFIDSLCTGHLRSMSKLRPVRILPQIARFYRVILLKTRRINRLERTNNPPGPGFRIPLAHHSPFSLTYSIQAG